MAAEVAAASATPEAISTTVADVAAAASASGDDD